MAPIKMAGDLHIPKDISEGCRYVAIVCVHPAGGVKEQTAGLYAVKLAEAGMKSTRVRCLVPGREYR
jgi:fermentation-respiration switch protein FrsA (DUF1100 family)